MKKENLIHVKFENFEAVQSKKDLLSLEMNLLKIAQIIQRYGVLRLEELKVKSELHQKTSVVKANLKKLQALLPKLQTHKVLGHDEISFRRDLPGKESYDRNIETQLQEIQAKLKALSK